jgi:hypothetical protein
MATDMSLMAVQGVLMERRSQVASWQGRGVEQFTGGLPVMDRPGRTVRRAHSGQFSMAGG